MLRDHLSYETTFFLYLEQSLNTGLTVHVLMQCYDVFFRSSVISFTMDASDLEMLYDLFTHWSVVQESEVIQPEGE